MNFPNWNWPFSRFSMKFPNLSEKESVSVIKHENLKYDSIICGCCSIAKSCPTLWDTMDCSMPGLPVPHYLPEFAQVQVHWIGDAIQPSLHCCKFASKMSTLRPHLRPSERKSSGVEPRLSWFSKLFRWFWRCAGGLVPLNTAHHHDVQIKTKE